jgi:hypothetical protein
MKNATSGQQQVLKAPATQTFASRSYCVIILIRPTCDDAEVRVRLFDDNWMQIEEYLRRDDRAVLPTGSTEQHGFPSLGSDVILAERVAVEAAEPLGIPVLPAVPFGMAPYALPENGWPR